jgi:recombination protein RecR
MVWALESLENLRAELQKMPGIGTKSAERLAYYILRCSESDAIRLASAIRDVKCKIRQCSVCFNITEQDPCTICASPKRDASLLCVVELPRDVMAIEATGEYDGLYHVLQGRISPLEGIDPEHLTLEALVSRVRQGEVREVILATNPDIEGDGTALYVAEVLRGEDVEVTRIAKGIPTGSSIEFVGKSILRDALSGRRGISDRGPVAAQPGG